MKPYFVFISAAALLSACAGPSTEQKADSTAVVTPEAVVVTAASISEYAGDVDETSAGNRTLTLHNYTNGTNPYAVVAVFNNNSRPLRVYMYPEGKITDSQTETWVYIDSLSGKPVLLREMIKTTDKVTENSFYYRNDSLIQAETRSAKDLAALENATLSTFEPSGNHATASATDSLCKSLLSAVQANGKVAGQDTSVLVR